MDDGIADGVVGLSGEFSGIVFEDEFLEGEGGAIQFDQGVELVAFVVVAGESRTGQLHGGGEVVRVVEVAVDSEGEDGRVIGEVLEFFEFGDDGMDGFALALEDGEGFGAAVVGRGSGVSGAGRTGVGFRFEAGGFEE